MAAGMVPFKLALHDVLNMTKLLVIESHGELYDFERQWTILITRFMQRSQETVFFKAHHFISIIVT
jgi:hypothetical protein